MDFLRSDTETPPAFVVAAVGGGLLFLLGGVLTAMTPDDRGVLIIGTVAFLLLGIYTLIVVMRRNRLVEENRALDEQLAGALERDRRLRARLAITIREPVASLVTFSDRLAEGDGVDPDERRLMIEELRSSARELDRVLVDLADAGDAPTPRVMSVVRMDEELASVAASTVGSIEFESWLEPARAWADSATVRQVLRAIIGGVRDGGCPTVVLKTASAGDQVTTTLSGRCALLSPTAIEAVTEGTHADDADDRHTALASAHAAVVGMGGTINHTQALGVSHLVIDLPAAPDEIRAQRPKPRPVTAVPVVHADQRTPAPVATASATPSLRFD